MAILTRFRIPRWPRLLAGATWAALLGLVLLACGQEQKSESTLQPTPTQNASAAGLQVGDAAPFFSLPASDGSTVTLDDYRGKQPVLLFFHMADG
ncbi:MAG: hypothetical protein Kow00106_10910 [Anaerolineae bacterium]